MHEFGDIYTSYCDCVAVVDLPGCPDGEYAILTRGVETLNEEGLRMLPLFCAALSTRSAP